MGSSYCGLPDLTLLKTSLVDAPWAYEEENYIFFHLFTTLDLRCNRTRWKKCVLHCRTYQPLARPSCKVVLKADAKWDDNTRAGQTSTKSGRTWHYRNSWESTPAGHPRRSCLFLLKLSPHSRPQRLKQSREWWWWWW